MNNRQVKLSVITLVTALLLLGIYADSSAGKTTQPLILDSRVAAAADARPVALLPQQIVVTVVVPIPASDSGTGSTTEGEMAQADDNRATPTASTPSATGTPSVTGNSGSGSETSQASDQNQEGASTGESQQNQGDSSDSANGDQMSDQELINNGEQVFADNCASCHGPDGEGGGSYPALAGNSFVTSDDISGPLNTILHGRGQMPSFENQLSDQEVASVLSYVRNSWGNDASVVHVSQLSQDQGNGSTAIGGEQDDGTNQEQATEQVQATQTPEPENGTVQAMPTGEPTSETTNEAGGASEITIRIRIYVVTPSPSGEVGTSTGDMDATQSQATPSPEVSPTATSQSGAETQSNGDTQSSEDTPDSESTPPAGVEQGGETSTSADEPQDSQQAEESNGQQDATDSQQLINQGNSLYSAYCAACHQPGGQGIEGIYPPLAGNPFVTAEDPTSVLQVVLTGRGGMPHFGEYLTTEELAAVISYVRNGWDNNASVVSAEQVDEAAQQFSSAAEVVEH